MLRSPCAMCHGLHDQIPTSGQSQHRGETYNRLLAFCNTRPDFAENPDVVERWRKMRRLPATRHLFPRTRIGHPRQTTRNRLRRFLQDEHRARVPRRHRLEGRPCCDGSRDPELHHEGEIRSCCGSQDSGWLAQVNPGARAQLPSTAEPHPAATSRIPPAREGRRAALWSPPLAQINRSPSQ